MKIYDVHVEPVQNVDTLQANSSFEFRKIRSAEPRYWIPAGLSREAIRAATRVAA
jgi:hypothetical protein